MDRRDLLKGTGLLMGAMLLPAYGRVVAAEVLSTKLDLGFKKKLADVALNAATKGGASYCDVRIGRYLRQFVITRETKVENIVNTESLGAGIRVIVNGAWGFAATNDLSEDDVAAAAAQAVGIAKANAKIQTEPVQLAPNAGVGEVSWATPIVRNSMEVPIKQKVDLLMSVNNAALKSGADFIRSILFLVNEQKYFASTDGSYIDQDIHRIWAPTRVTAVDKKSGKFRIRSGLSAPMGMGYEYLDARKDGHIQLPGGATVYSTSYDMHADAIAAAKQARQKLKAPSVKPGKYDLVLDPSHLWLTIHESVGHPTELDRVLGMEANYAGTSFLTLEKKDSLQFGSKIVNLVADATLPHGLATFGFDDDGVEAQRWPIVKDGLFTGYLTSRELAHRVGDTRSRGCVRSDGWFHIPMIRMVNLSLMPGKGSLEDLLNDSDDALYMETNRSWSIDQLRYNFQFKTEVAWEIKKGKRVRMLKNPTYQGITTKFWNSCDFICGQEAWKPWGVTNCGKGQPGQVAEITHGASPARFRKVLVGAGYDA